MIYVKPDFFDDFKCIASRCKDNCCIGWEIDIDDFTYDSYRSMNTGFSNKIKENIIEASDGSRCFKLAENDRCPFLNKDNLCDIIINCGGTHLCDICREHPRFYEWFPGVTECGLGLSCEEVCRILLKDDEPLTLVEYNDGEKIELQSKDDVVESDTYIFLSAFRERLFDVLKRTDIPFNEKIVKILAKTESFTGEEVKVRGYKKSVSEYKKTEPIDGKWTQYINELSENIDDIISSEELFDKITGGDMPYSKILAYILYRHFIKSVFDMGIRERIIFAVESVRFIKLCDMKTFLEKGSLTLSDRVENLKNWSKQIEYSDENTDMMIYGD